ncbi:Ig-like domain-containing protein [Marinicella sp. W31]|uniref:Ig-like domain-containing protein n=1 Tax=Marinicella sp. W31 TaxID=3023713 RepID=UPI003756A04A
MKVRKVLLASLMICGSVSTANAVDIMTESFETDGNGSRYISTPEFDQNTTPGTGTATASDHWGRSDGSEIANITGAYTGADGSFFWAGEDVNDDGGNGQLPQTLEFTDIDITGASNLAFTGLFGAGNERLPGNSNYDAADFIRVEYRIDGSGADPFTPGVCFGYERQSPSDDSNEPFGLDADCDGESDGVAGRLGTVLTEYGFNIAGTGSTLDLLISVSVDSGSEEIAFDNLILSGDVGPVSLLTETFETDGNGSRYTSTPEFDQNTTPGTGTATASDHWGRSDGSEIANITGAYTGADGSFFWAGEDVNDDGGNGQLPQTLEFTDIDITGFSNLAFTGLFGAGNERLPGNSNYDAADFIRVEYRIDGSGADPFTPGVCFGYERQSPSDDSNEPFGLDADCDGESDGVAGRLGTVLTEYGFNIAGTGSTLDLLISVSVDSGSEEIAFDNIIITGGGGVVDNPPTVTGSTPVDGSVGFATDGNVVINLSEDVDATMNAVTFSCTQSGTVTFDGLPVDDMATLTLNPVSDLMDTEECTVTLLAAEVTDIDGTPDTLAADFVLTFTVGFPIVEIFEIQGTGTDSPFNGIRVTTNDNIVTALDTNGFYMQTPDARDDADAATSNGIFVFTNDPPTVQVGDQVDVTGDVVEFFGLTEFTNSPDITVDSMGNAVPTAIVLDDNFPSTDPEVFPCGMESLEYECFEGMLFDMPQGFISQPYVSFFGFNRDDLLVKAGSSRAFREPGIDFPGEVGLPVFDGNPELLEVDIDGLTLPLVPLSAGSSISMQGVFGFDFGEYELWPSDIQFIQENVLPGAVRDANADEITVASANLFRLFNDVDDAGMEDDDQIADPAEYAQRLEKISNYFRNDLKAPMIIAVQEVESIDVLNDLAAQITTDGGPTYTAALVEGNDRGGIDVGYLYQSNVTVVLLDQLGEAEELTVDNSLLHDRPPLRMQADVDVNGNTVRVNLLVVHMRSRGGIDDNTDGPRVRQKRLEQAQSVAVMVDDIQTNAPGEAVVVLGDYNAFQFTDGYVDVVGQIAGTAVQADNLLWEAPLFAGTPLTQAVDTVTADQQYSFIFRGSAQVLDNALLNDEALVLFSGMQYARGQADAPLTFEDNGATSQRSTDHDAFVVYLFDDTDLIFKNGFD